MTFAEAIGHNIKNCLNFKGRDPRSAFWFYILFVFIGAIVASGVDMAIVGSQFANTALFDPSTPPEEVFNTLFSAFENPWSLMFQFTPVSSIWYLLNLLPIFACGMRRMNDQDKRSWIFALLYIGLFAVSVAYLVIFVQMFTQMATTFGDVTGNAQFDDAYFDRILALTFWVTSLSFLQLGLVLVIIVLMATKGTTGPNRHGEDPLAVTPPDLPNQPNL